MNASRRLTLNMAVGIVYQVVVLAANFLTKQAVRYQLGTDYLGMQTVFANICDVLIFAFGGLGLAMVYQLYGAFDQGDTQRQTAVVRFFDALYRKVAWCALGIGALAFGIVLWSVDAPVGLAEIALTYGLFLLGVVVDARFKLYYYFFMADQRRYVASVVCTFAEVAFTLLGVRLLYAGCPYAVFLACLVAKSACIAALFKAYARRRYPHLAQPGAQLPALARAGIKKDVGDLIVSHVGNTLLTSTDSVIISGIVGTAVAGCYSGYYFIIAGILSLVRSVFDPVMSFVGKLQAGLGPRQVFEAFVRVHLACLCLTAMCVASFYWLANDFMVLWMGEEVLLPHAVLAVCSVNLFMGVFRQAVSAFRLSAGLFAKVSRVILLRGVLNVALSLVMGYLFGLVGILLATTLCDAATLYWYEPYVLYRHFGRPLVIELGFQVAGAALAGAALAAGGLAAAWVGPSVSWLLFAAKACAVALASCVPSLPLVGLYAVLRRCRRHGDRGSQGGE